MFDLAKVGKKLLPLSLLTGLADTKGEYVSTLWSVCDCTAQNPLIPTLPNLGLDLLKGKLCKGPLCALIPKLKLFGVDLKDLQVISSSKHVDVTLVHSIHEFKEHFISTHGLQDGSYPQLSPVAVSCRSPWLPFNSTPAS
jgi:hypothetical protein